MLNKLKLFILKVKLKFGRLNTNIHFYIDADNLSSDVVMILDSKDNVKGYLIGFLALTNNFEDENVKKSFNSMYERLLTLESMTIDRVQILKKYQDKKIHRKVT